MPNNLLLCSVVLLVFTIPKIKNSDNFGNLPQSNQISLAIVFDAAAAAAASSVTVDLAKLIVNHVSSQEDNLIFNYILLSFSHNTERVFVTTHKHELHKALDDIRMNDVGDCSENPLNKIIAALEKALRNPYIYIFTDATARDFELQQELISLVQQKVATLIFVLNGNCGDRNTTGYTVYENLAKISNGRIYNFTIDQSVNIESILDDVRNQFGKRRGSRSIETDNEEQLTVHIPHPEYITNENEEQIEIPCSITPTAKTEFSNVKWYFNHTEIDSSDSIYKISGTNLIISDPKKELAGYYKCEASIGIEINSASTYLKVEYAPLLIEPQYEDIWIKYESTAYINCTGDALPPAKAKWGRISGGPLNFKQIDNALVIPSFNFSDIGVYLCNLYNGIEPSADRQVKLQGLPSHAPRISKPDLKSFNVFEGDDVILICHCTLCTPSAAFAYKSVGNQDNDTIPYKSEDNPEYFRLKINFKNISLSDSGKYRCVLRNEIGSSEKTIDLNVKSSPNIEHLKNVHQCNVNKHINSIDLKATSSNLTITSKIYDCISDDQSITVMLLENHLNEKVQSILIHSNELDSEINCTSSRNESASMTQIESNSKNKSTALNANSDTLKCVLPQNTPASIKIDTVLAVYIDPNSILKNDAQAISVKSNRVPIVKCAKTAQVKWFEQPYVCESFNYVSTSSDSFNIIVQDPPTIQPDLEKNVRLIKGKSTTITCSAIGSPDVQVFWKDGDVEMQDNVLSIDSKKETFKEKNFTCVAVNQYGYDSQIVLVSIIDRPEFISPAESCDEKSIHLGSSLNLPCPFKHFNHIKWLKNGKIFNDDSINLEIMNISLSDGGAKFCCIAENEAGTNECCYKIVVYYAPVIQNVTLNNTIVDVNETDDFTTDCQATGFPAPQIEWIHDGKIISKDQTLYVGNLTKENNGKYYCSAKNDHGISKITFQLNVLYAPQREIDSQQTELDVLENHSIYLNCSVSGSNPAPTFEWQKNEVKIPDANKNFLAIQNASTNDSGTYKCIASNIVSSVDIQFTVNVLAGASIRFTTSNLTINSTDPISISCEAFGIPVPDLTWIYADQILLSSLKSNMSSIDVLDVMLDVGKNVNTSNDLIDESFTEIIKTNQHSIDNSTPNIIKMVLHLNKSVPLGVHRFDCIAFNKYGKDKRSIFIERIAAPDFLSKDNETFSIVQGLSVIFNCSCTAHPQSQITWLKNGNALNLTSPKFGKYSLEKNNMHLKIASVTVDDRDVYSCVATNKIGTNAKSFALDVLIPPSLDPEFSTVQNDSEKELIIQYGDAPMSLKCPVIGYPTPQIIWSSDANETLMHQSEMLINSSAMEMGSLSESFKVICMANNTLGHFNYTFKILIKSLPVFEASAAIEQRFDFNDDFSLDCSAFGVPEPKISWYKDEKLLTIENLNEKQNSTDFIHFTGLTDDAKQLLVANATIENFAKYKCVAENRWGSIERTFDIIFNPYWSEWSTWSQCSKTCDTGFQHRRRFCHKMQSHPNPGNCIGKDMELVKCKRKMCPWSEWSSCSTSCGKGQMYRYRDCVGEKCNHLQVTSCFKRSCTPNKRDFNRFGPLYQHN